MTALWVALAGGLGAGTRYLADSWLRPRLSAFPGSTHVVNFSGSLLLGLLVGAGADDPWHTIAGVGFLGGYTTFSAASVEAAGMVLDRRHVAAFAHVALMVVGSLAAAALGHAIGRATR